VRFFPQQRCERKFVRTASDITFNSFNCRLVKPGGMLIYSARSIDPEENENRISAFIQRHPVLSEASGME
jgi:hypothetical protein